jgi:hypothetical protein
MIQKKSGRNNDAKPMIFKPFTVWAIMKGYKFETRRLSNRYNLDAGDNIWIREQWCQENYTLKMHYKSDYFLKGSGFVDNWNVLKWKSPIIMPKTAARLILTLTEVRQELLGDITEDGAIAEGIGAFRTLEMVEKNMWPSFLKSGPNSKPGYESPIFSFMSLWNSINDQHNWETDKDKIIWVYRFDWELTK